MEAIVNWKLEDSTAFIQMDDGKNNVFSLAMQAQLNAALDKAEAANAIVVLTGREDIFCAGFDLDTFKSSAIDSFRMIIGGFELAKRLLSFPTPVIVACNGHAIAMGSFLLLSADYRIGVDGDFRIVANEVELGITMPHSAIEICRQRINPSYLSRTVLLSEVCSPKSAIDAGFFDKVVTKDTLQEEALTLAQRLTSLDLKAHYKSKLRMRQETLKAITKAIRMDRLAVLSMGVEKVFKGSKS